MKFMTIPAIFLETFSLSCIFLSGFGKIIRSYEFQANYQEEKKPYFRSDRTPFTVVLPNLNYGVPQGVPQDVPQDDIDRSIVRLIRKDNRISTDRIAEKLSLSSKTIKRRIAKMPCIKYVGNGYSGHWEVIDD